jgi:hypothetical protein
MSQADLVRRAGLKQQSHLNRILAGTDPSLTVANRLARAVGWDLTQLNDGDVYSKPEVLLTGYVGGADMWQEASRATAKRIPLDILAKDLVAVEVTTNEWAPRYAAGDILCGTKALSANLHNLLGRDCIVETNDGTRMVKYLTRSSIKGRVTLRSFLPSRDDITDAKIAWAAPIELVIRGAS